MKENEALQPKSEAVNLVQALQQYERPLGANDIRVAQNVCALYGNDYQLLTEFNPSKGKDIMRNPVAASAADVPTLAQLTIARGEYLACTFVENLIVTLENYCAFAKRLSDVQRQSLANTIIGRYGQLKVTEFILFIEYVKAGEFGELNPYGISPTGLTSALKKFAYGDALSNLRNKARQIQAAQERENSKGQKAPWAVRALKLAESGYKVIPPEQPQEDTPQKKRPPKLGTTKQVGQIIQQAQGGTKTRGRKTNSQDDEF